MKGKFITFEGCEGVGKSTQLAFLKDYYEKNGISALFTREPGGNVISEKIRGIILDRENVGMNAECEALLYAAARAQLAHTVLLPTLEKGINVVCDRFIDSSYAYQGYARGLGIDFVRAINEGALDGVMPDLTVFLDLDPEKAFARKGGRDKDDRLENEKMEFHKKVYQGYLKACELFPDRIVRIDASGTKYQTHDKIISVLKERNFI